MKNYPQHASAALAIAGQIADLIEALDACGDEDMGTSLEASRQALMKAYRTLLMKAHTEVAMPRLVLGGNAYSLGAPAQGDLARPLVSAPLRRDGLIDESQWGLVDFHALDGDPGQLARATALHGFLSSLVSA